MADDDALFRLDRVVLPSWCETEPRGPLRKVVLERDRGAAAMSSSKALLSSFSWLGNSLLALGGGAGGGPRELGGVGGRRAPERLDEFGEFGSAESAAAAAMAMVVPAMKPRGVDAVREVRGVRAVWGGPESTLTAVQGVPAVRAGPEATEATEATEAKEETEPRFLAASMAPASDAVAAELAPALPYEKSTEPGRRKPLPRLLGGGCCSSGRGSGGGANFNGSEKKYPSLADLSLSSEALFPLAMGVGESGASPGADDRLNLTPALLLALLPLTMEVGESGASTGAADLLDRLATLTLFRLAREVGESGTSTGATD